jgi:hypothetical protein
VDRVFAKGRMHELAGKSVEVKRATPKGSGPAFGRGVPMQRWGAVAVPAVLFARISLALQNPGTSDKPMGLTVGSLEQPFSPGTDLSLQRAAGAWTWWASPARAGQAMAWAMAAS